MSWETSADATDALSADAADVLSADTTGALSAQQMCCLQTHHLRQRFPLLDVEGPGLFSAITCNTWLRLQFRPLDSAWSFGAQLPLSPDWGAGWAKDLFQQKMGPGKGWLCGGNGSPWGFMGICAREMDRMVSRRPLGKPVSPQSPPEQTLCRDFAIS